MTMTESRFTDPEPRAYRVGDGDDYNDARKGEHFKLIGQYTRTDDYYDHENSEHTVTYTRAAGAPTNWVKALATWLDVEASTVKRGRNKKGTTAEVTRHGRIMRTVVGDDRESHLDALLAPNGQLRMSDAQIARWATDWARGECAVCAAYWEACDQHEHDPESDDYADHCTACVGKCDCIDPVEGGMTVAYADVIHAGEGAECAVAQRHGSLADACNGMPIAVLDTVKANYVSSESADRTESKIAWPVRTSLPTPSWRKSETTTVESHVWNGRWIDAPVSVTYLPSPMADQEYRIDDAVNEDASWFLGHSLTHGRGPTADAVRTHARTLVSAEIAHARAVLAEQNDSAMDVGETLEITDGAMLVTIRRESAARYKVVRGKVVKSARTFTGARNLAERLAI